jgi:hypothetical protein
MATENSPVNDGEGNARGSPLPTVIPLQLPPPSYSKWLSLALVITWLYSPVVGIGVHCSVFRPLRHHRKLLDCTGVSKRSLHGYTKCCCLASVTKKFAFKGLQTVHRSRC